MKEDSQQVKETEPQRRKRKSSDGKRNQRKETENNEALV
jgi:hypothetical protein